VDVVKNRMVGDFTAPAEATPSQSVHGYQYMGKSIRCSRRYLRPDAYIEDRKRKGKNQWEGKP
jgi:hypothetical protein